MVSRETPGDLPENLASAAPSPPDTAGRVFASGLGLAQAYADLLATEGVVRGVIGPREGPRLWDRHLVGSAVLGDAIPEGFSVCDVGSGAGLPGLALAIARPDLSVTLVEPLQRRIDFLADCVRELGLGHVELVRARAEDVHGTRTFDVVTSRAVAPLPRLAAWSMPLVSATGAMLAMKGASARDEARAATADLFAHGCAPPEVVVLGQDLLDPPVRVVRVVWEGDPRVGWGDSGGARSRRPARAKRRPRRR